MRETVLTALIIFFSLSSLTSSLSIAQSKFGNYYERGKDKLASGDWQTALEIWFEGKQHLEERGESDPRIALSFIELATDRQAEQYYEKASNLYYWGISQNSLENFKKDFEKEVERISPILKKTEYEDWKSDLKKGWPGLPAKIKTFWLEKDPDPTTVLNERLIEHWQRIAYARKNFKKNKNTIYDTDDRGLIYVKYGEPENKREVVLGDNSAEIYNVAWEYNISAREKGEFRVAIENYLNYPDCEVWAYRSLNLQEPIIYVFGRDEGNGPFGLRTSIEEFIPERAFRGTNRWGVVPGAVLQLLYYSELSSFDMSFSSRVNELDENLALATRPFKSNAFSNRSIAKGLHIKFRVVDADSPAKRNAPKEQFDPEKYITSIPLVSNRTRFLDKRNKPILVFMAFAFPPQAVKTDPLEIMQSDALPDYKLRFSLQLRDADMKITDRVFAQPIAGFDNTGFFKIPHDDTQAHYTLASVASGSEDDSLTQNLPKVGKVFFEKVDLLNSDPEKLEVSDLVIGVEPSDLPYAEMLPFPVVQTDKIWRGDVLQVYLEVYHLKIDEKGFGHFTLDSRIIRLKKKGKKFERRELVATSFEFNSTGSTVKEDFGISMANYNPGNYELEVEISDKISGEKKKRVAAFEIKEKITSSMK